MNASAHWPSVVGFYDALIREHDRDLEPMLDVAKRIAASPWGDVLFPSTSHESLGLSVVETYEKRLEHPMVYVGWRPTQREFEIDFQEHQGLTTRTLRSTDVLSATTWDEIIVWLGARLP